MIERSTIARIGKVSSYFLLLCFILEFQELAEMQTLLKSVQTKFTALDYDDDDILNWKVTILGPQKTPYAGGSFVLRISFPYNYPKAPPSVIFETTIYHPNIDTQTGRVCNPYLSREKAWTKDVKISMSKFL
jgi:ubiquitin-conjugating enzyme E2 D/E